MCRIVLVKNACQLWDTTPWEMKQSETLRDFVGALEKGDVAIVLDSTETEVSFTYGNTKQSWFKVLTRIGVGWLRVGKVE